MTSERSIQFACVQTYLSEQEATLALNELQSGGIRAVLESSSAVTTFSYVGSAMGGVRLMVEESELAEARSILRGLEASASDEPWYCARCKETVEPSFECCWSCGGERDEVAGPLPGADANASNQGIADSASPAIGNKVYDQAGDRADHQEAEQVAEDLSTRAWRAAIFGLVTLPLLLHIYSLVLILQAPFQRVSWTTPQITRLIGALVIDILAIWGFPIMLASFWLIP